MPPTVLTVRFWKALRLWRLVQLSLLLLSAALAGVSCGGDDGLAEVLHVQGRTLEIQVYQPIIARQFLFDYEGQVRKLEVPDPSRRLAAVQIIVISRNITFVPMGIDEESAQLGNALKGEKYYMIDPLESSEALVGVPPDSGVYDQIMWGDFELTKGTQARGWMFFDIPVGLKTDTLWWYEGDQIIARFAGYAPPKS
jgi:hypothetical protein